MTIADLTRPRAGGALPPGRSCRGLVDGASGCPACSAAAGELCEFHSGWAEGWDACAADVAAWAHTGGDAGGAS